jgi:predicted O-linked N-acetylglucosamine transferase (SPINDLY family)
MAKSAKRRKKKMSRTKTSPANQTVDLLQQAIKHHQSGQFPQAKKIYRKILEMDGNQFVVLHNLGVLIMEEGNPEQALSLFKKTLTLKPDHAQTYNSMGLALYHLGLLNEAIDAFRSSLEIDPEDPTTHCNLGMVLKDKKMPDAAIACYRVALRLNPQDILSENNIGSILKGQKRLDAAAASFRKVLAVAPDFAEVHYNLGNTYGEMRQHDDALACYRRAIELKPDYADALSNILMTMHYASSTNGQDFFAAAINWAKPYNEGRLERTFTNATEPERKLRIGYVSADFSRHPVGYYLSGILPFHNDDTVEVVGYSNSHKSDDITERLRAGATNWRNVTDLSDEAMATQITDDGIDILVDLSGHTAGHRLPVFARRPAPVQVSWMGYTGTTGLTAIDYILADRFVIPENDIDLFSENVKYFSGCYLCFEPPRYDIATNEPPALKAGFITFGSFNNLIKITNETISEWANILAVVANSQLLLKTSSLDDEGMRQSLIEAFEKRGIDSKRILLEGRSPRADLLKAYQRIDIALDTMPFNGGVTTAEALWMGVPVISLRSPRWTGCLGETILNAVGLPGLVANDPKHYHELAVTLAHDLPRLEQLHGELRSRVETSAFCDGPAFANKLEHLYRQIWQDWCGEKETT